MAWRSLLILTLMVGSAVAASPENFNTCQGCRSLVSYARTLNSSIHRQEYADMIKGFCELYYPPSTDFQQGPCPMFIQGLTYVLDNTDPITHCDDIGACGPAQPSDDMYQYLQSSNSVEAPSQRKPEPHDAPLCDFCVQTIDQMKAILTNPAAVERLRRQADAFCAYMKVIDGEEQCKEIIDKYLDDAVSMIKFIKSRDYCVGVHLCPFRLVRATSEKTQLPTLADFKNFGIETSVSIGPKPAQLENPTSHKKGPQCTLCKTLVKEMFKFLHDDKTEANIIKGLNNVCSLIYHKEPKRGECQSMVKAYTRELVQLLIDETDPEVICMLLQQCTYDPSSKTPQQNAQASETVHDLRPKPEAPKINHPETHELAQLITALDPSIGLKSIRSCVECKMFIKYLKDRLSDQKSQDELKQWLLDNLCKELPEKGLVDSCTAMVQSYANIFFQAVVGDLNPQAACVELGVCSAKSFVQVLNIGGGPSSLSLSPDQIKLTALKRLMMAKQRRCTRCTDVVSFIDDYLVAHPRGEDIAAVSKVCDNTDDSVIRGECLWIVGQYGADIVQAIPTMESPRHLCKQISLC